jgi:hypothetical protein
MQNKTTSKKTSKKDKKVNEVSKINFDKFTKELSNVEVKEKKKKETLYKYPEGFTEQKINGEEGKKFRNKLRNAMKRYCANILTFTKTKQEDNLKKEFSLFNKFYKENYRLNDLSINSITNTKNEDKEKELVLMLQIIKEYNK